MKEPNASIDWLAGWGDRKLDGDFYIRQAFITHLSESLSTKHYLFVQVVDPTIMFAS